MNNKTMPILAGIFIVALVIVGLAAFWAGRLTSPVGGGAGSGVDTAKPTTYYCSMHPHITLPHEGKCSICGMDLIPMTGSVDYGPRTLKLSKAAMQLAEIETAKVERRFVESRVAMVGKVEFDETAVKTITAWVPGRLDRLYVDYTGVPVAKGDHLADIYSPKLYEAQQQLIEALRTVENSEGDSDLIRRSSQGTLEAVRKKLILLGLTESQVREIEEKKTLDKHIQINATFGGVVVEKLADEGDYVETGEPLYKVVSLDHLWVKLDAYESDLAWIRYGQEVSFHTEAYPGEKFSGTVSFIDWVVNHHTRTIKIRLNVDNSEGRLKPGMFVRAETHSNLAAGGRVMSPALAGKWISPMHPEIVKDGPGPCDICGMDLVPAEKLYATAGEDEKPPLVIPDTAPLITGRRAVVYVRKKGDASLFEGRDIVLGPRAGSSYIVLGGLSEGEEVVTRGNFKIDSSLQIEAKPSMMNPGGGGGPAGHDHGGGTRQGQTPDPAEMAKLPFPEEFGKGLEQVFEVYSKITAALVKGELESAESSFAHFGKVLEGVSVETLAETARSEWDEIGRNLSNSVVLASMSSDLKTLRGIYADLSQAVLHLEHRFGHPDGTLFEAHCPMALGGTGGTWLQGSRDIENPYFGASMLKCGEIRNEFSSVAPAPAAREEPEEPADRETPETSLDESKVLGDFLPRYLAVGDALAGDDSKKAREAAGNALQGLAENVKGAEGTFTKTVKELSAALDRIAATESIEEQRVGFEDLSNAFRSSLKEFRHTSETPVHEFFCPMAFKDKGAFWLQGTEKTSNPYFGASMLRCGAKKTTLPALSPKSNTEVKAKENGEGHDHE